MKTISYFSKIDLWLLIVFGLASVLLLLGIRQCYLQKTPSSLFMAVYLLLVIITIWLPVFSTKYILSDTHLIVKSMFFKWEIELEDINSVEAVRDFSSAPALSIDRVQIQYTKNGVRKSVSISPINVADFLNKINKN